MNLIKISTKKFDPNKWPEGVWSTFAPGAEIKIRKLNGSIIRELRKPLIVPKIGLNPVTKMMEETESYDQEKWSDILSDYTIENFKGFGDDDGNILPVNLENKKAMLNQKQVREFVMSVAEAVEIIAAREAEGEIKNS